MLERPLTFKENFVPTLPWTTTVTRAMTPILVIAAVAAQQQHQVYAWEFSPS